MKPETMENFKVLDQSLDELIKVYRLLLSVLRKEREILISANLQELNENNKTKEAALIRAKDLEDARIEASKKMAQSMALSENTRLLEFARQMGGSEGERLRSLHSVLELLLKRVREHNSQNEILVNSALDSITGGIGSIRDTLKDKPTYKKSGSVTTRPADSGQLVSKEA